jgi:anti-sigma regulatory factor (Ser/Thr protein kinase)
MGTNFHEGYEASDAAPGQARDHIAAYLREHGRTDLIADATLLVSELVTNAVTHAGGSIELRARLEGPGLHVEVTDGSAVLPRVRPPGVDGRGLHIVEALAAAWGANLIQGDGKHVWFELEARRSI